MRLAWFSPWPPQASGVAGISTVVVDQLAAIGHAVDVFVDDRAVATTRTASADGPAPGRVRVQSAHDFVWRHARGQFDLAVYQLGNSQLHQYIWPYVFQFPGLAVLHDARLHHARARALLGTRRPDEYRAEFAFDHPESAPAAELAVPGFDGPYYYLWPMTRAIVAVSKLTAAHTMGGARDLATAWPGRAVDYVALGQDALPPLSPDARRSVRDALGLADDAIVFGVFGALTADKRLPQIVRAFAQVARIAPRARLVVAGAADPAVDMKRLALQFGVGEAILSCGVLDDAAFDRTIAAVDISLNLRWPTAIETSGPWVRAISAGLPTVTTALAHQSEVPALDPRDWSVSPIDGDAATIAIDIVDEDHSLALAMRRLATDAALRASLGRGARRYWEAEHTVARMIEDYRRVIDRAAALPAPVVDLPAHLRPEPIDHVRRTLADLPEVSCALR
jgi:glycosyltransferase involved in cell wall biosynthesis